MGDHEKLVIIDEALNWTLKEGQGKSVINLYKYFPT